MGRRMEWSLHVCHSVCPWKAVCRSKFSVSYLWVLGMELLEPALVASAFTLSLHAYPHFSF